MVHIVMVVQRIGRPLSWPKKVGRGRARAAGPCAQAVAPRAAAVAADARRRRPRIFGQARVCQCMLSCAVDSIAIDGRSGGLCARRLTPALRRARMSGGRHCQKSGPAARGGGGAVHRRWRRWRRRRRRGARRRSDRCIFWSISPEHVELANVFKISRREPASLGARLIEITRLVYIDACTGTKMTNFREKPVPGELLAIFSGTVSDSAPTKAFLKNVPPGCIHCLTMGFFSALE